MQLISEAGETSHASQQRLCNSLSLVGVDVISPGRWMGHGGLSPHSDTRPRKRCSLVAKWLLTESNVDGSTSASRCHEE